MSVVASPAVLTPKNARGRPVTKLCLTLEAFRRTDEGRIRDAKAFLGHYFPTDKDGAKDRMFIHIPKEVRADLLSNWGIRGKKSALRDDDERVRTTVQDALAAGDIDAPTIEEGMAPEILIDWAPLDDWWSFWRGSALPVGSVRKALAVARDLSLFDERWFLEHLVLRSQRVEGTDVICAALSKEQIVTWLGAVHASGDATPTGLVAAIGWDTILTKTAHEALTFALDSLARQIGLAEHGPDEALSRKSDMPRATADPTGSAAPPLSPVSKPPSAAAAAPSTPPKPEPPPPPPAPVVKVEAPPPPPPAKVEPPKVEAPPPKVEAPPKPVEAAKPAAVATSATSAAAKPPPPPPVVAKAEAKPAAKPPPPPITKPQESPKPAPVASPVASPVAPPVVVAPPAPPPSTPPTSVKPSPVVMIESALPPVAIAVPAKAPPQRTFVASSDLPSVIIEPDPEPAAFVTAPAPPPTAPPTSAPPSARVLFGAPPPAGTPVIPGIADAPPPMRPPAPTLSGVGVPPPQAGSAPGAAPGAAAANPALFGQSAEVAIPSFHVPPVEDPAWAPPRAEPGDMGWDLVYGVKRSMATNVKPAYNFDDDDEPTSEIALPPDTRHQ